MRNIFSTRKKNSKKEVNSELVTNPNLSQEPTFDRSDARQEAFGVSRTQETCTMGSSFGTIIDN